MPRQSPARGSHVPLDVRELALERLRATDEHQGQIGGEVSFPMAVCFAEPTPDTVAVDRPPNLPAHRETSSATGLAGSPQGHERPPLHAARVLEDRLDLASVP
jgi:hypothetical protein